MIVYPDASFYSMVKVEDIPEIVLPEDIDGSYFRATAGSTGEQKVEMFEQATRTARRNLKLFENYFLHEWCVDKLDAGDCEKLREWTNRRLTSGLEDCWKPFAVEDIKIWRICRSRPIILN